MSTGARRRAAGALAITAVALGVLTAGPADAATAYRYWSYWHGDTGSWVYSSRGAGTYHPADGSVEGWRFGVGEDSQSAPKPRAAASSFADVCGGTTAGSGQIRVAVIADFGTAGDAPDGQHPPYDAPVGRCAVLATGQTGADALAKVRFDPYVGSNGTICSLNGYPRGECGAAVAPKPTQAPATAAAPAPAPEQTTTARRSSPATAAAPAGRPVATTTTSAPSATPRRHRTLTARAASPSPTPTLLLGDAARPHPAAGGGLPVGLIAGSLLVAGIGGAGIWLSRRAS